MIQWAARLLTLFALSATTGAAVGWVVGKVLVVIAFIALGVFS